MKYSINIDQINSLAWDLNLSEAAVFTYLFHVPTWADPVLIDGQTFYFAARQKTCQDVPLISDKPDTIYRIYKSLAEKGVIEYLKHMGKDCMKITEKGKGWNSEKNPSITIELGKKSESTRKIFRKDSEKNPTYKSTIDYTTNDKIIELQKQNDILAIVHDQVDETAVKVVEVIPSKAKKQPKYIYPPTIEELVQPIYEKLIEKKRIHPNIVDCWNWANHQAEAFWLYHDKTGWKVEKLNGAIATWINKAIQYKTVIVPCPIQYKGNPANAQPAQPTKVHVEERPVLTQHDIEYSQAAFASVEQMFKQMGV